MAYILPGTENLDRWIEETARQAQGKRQIKLSDAVSSEYKRLKEYAVLVSKELSRSKSI